MRLFGRGFAPDYRDHLLALGKSRRTHRYWNDTNWFGDQKQTPHCVGFAWSHWLNCGPIINNLNPDGIYHFAKFVDEWQGEDYDGTSVRAGAKVLKALGMISSYAWSPDIDTLAYSILENGPAVVGTNWYSGMGILDSFGFVSLKGRLLGGHAYLITGINYTEGYFRCKNSWSTGWGIKGRFLITFDQMDRLLKEDGEACDASEQLPLASY